MRLESGKRLFGQLKRELEGKKATEKAKKDLPEWEVWKILRNFSEMRLNLAASGVRGSSESEPQTCFPRPRRCGPK